MKCCSSPLVLSMVAAAREHAIRLALPAGAFAEGDVGVPDDVAGCAERMLNKERSWPMSRRSVSCRGPGTPLVVDSAADVDGGGAAFGRRSCLPSSVSSPASASAAPVASPAQGTARAIAPTP